MKDLIQLYQISSPSGKEKRMRKYIKKWVRKQFPTASVDTDSAGNIYVTKGYADSYPCVVAHIDEVHDFRTKGFNVVACGDYIFGYDTTTKSQYGIGADDKNGIWVAFQCLKKYDDIKCAFFVGEEIGCIGSSQADMEFFSDCRFVLQCDRRGSTDFITTAGCEELCDDDFINRCDLAQFGYSSAHGLMTDVMELKSKGLQVACANISCGYYNPHTDSETTIFSELQNCLALVEHIIENVTIVCHHEPKPKTYDHYSRAIYGGYGGCSIYGKGTSIYYPPRSKYDTYNAFADDSRFDDLEADDQYIECKEVMFKEIDEVGFLEFDICDFYRREHCNYPLLNDSDYDNIFNELYEEYAAELDDTDFEDVEELKN